MQTKYYCPILIFYTTLFFYGVSYSQETHTVTLIVNTANFDRNNIDASCSIKAESPSTGVLRSQGDLQNFTLVVNERDSIVWEGVSSSEPGNAIHIKRIKYEKGTKIFNKDRLDGKARAGKGDIVRGKPIRTTINTEDFKYSLLFKIDSENGTFKIDPKIKVGR
jgi:hypothetical protein